MMHSGWLINLSTLLEKTPHSSGRDQNTLDMWHTAHLRCLLTLYQGELPDNQLIDELISDYVALLVSFWFLPSEHRLCLVSLLCVSAFTLFQNHGNVRQTNNNHL